MQFDVEGLKIQLWHMVIIVEQNFFQLVPRLALEVKVADKQLL